MLQRNLVYTGLTRGKKLGMIVGHESALQKAVSTCTQGERWSLTARFLKDEMRMREPRQEPDTEPAF